MITYDETLQYLYSQLPAFTRIGAAAYKADLNNILALCDALGNPQKDLKAIHVAGTNGKGSTSHFLASILQESGYKTGLFTSPHLNDFSERFRVNGIPISEREIIDFVNSNKIHFEEIKPSFFEMTVALAFQHFKEANTDIVVIETGLGGRLDSTNIITPILSIITNIGLDHTDLLGDTLDKIALEKAGIMKENCPVVISEFQAELEYLFRTKAKQLNSSIRFAEKEITWIKTNIEKDNEQSILVCEGQFQSMNIRLHSPVSGTYQLKNLKGVLCAIDSLNELGLDIPNEAIQRGVRNVIKNTSLRGRWQKLANKPNIYCDTGHNEDGIKYIVEQFKLGKYDQIHIVFGVVKDKKIDSILQLLPKEARYYFCAAPIFRSLPSTELKILANHYDLHGKAYNTVSEALESAKSHASDNDLIFIGGSTFVVAEII